MTRRAKLSALLLAAFLLGACTGGASTIQATAERAEFAAIAPEFLRYVEADAALSEEQKQLRRTTVELWDLRVAALEKAVSQ